MKLKFLSLGFLVGVLTATSAYANTLGNMQTLAPNPDSFYFQNVQSSKTLKKNYINVGSFVAYIRNELSAYDDLSTPEYVHYKDQAWALDVFGAWGVTDRLEVYYAAPFFLDQTPDSGQADNKYVSKGINVHRPGVKYDISNDPNGGYAAALSIDFPVAVDDPYVGTSPSPIYNIELIRDWRRRNDAFGVNLGYRFRKPGGNPANSYFYPLRDQIIASFAYVYGVGRNWRLHAEVYGSTVVDKAEHPQQKYVSAVEGLIGYKHKLARNFWGHIGTTAELMPEGLAPDFRVYAGFNYYFGFGEDVDPAPAPPQQDFAKVMAEPIDSQETAAVEEQVFAKNEPLQAPEQVEVYTGGRVSIPITGGTGKLDYHLTPEIGRYDMPSHTYFAPMQVGETNLVVTDKAYQTVTVRVIVKEIPPPEKEIRIRNVNFIFNTAKLTKASEQILAQNVDQFVGKSVQRVVIVGHTDSKGSDEYNQRLSLDRAETIARYVRSRLSLNESQVEAVGYGESRPIDTNETDAGRLNNRRVEFKVYYQKKR